MAEYLSTEKKLLVSAKLQNWIDGLIKTKLWPIREEIDDNSDYLNSQIRTSYLKNSYSIDIILKKFKTKAEIDSYKTLLAEGLVQPTEMELFTCNVDGSNLRQITFLGNANWSPFFHPSGKKILFSSNFEAIRGFPFNLYLIDVDGENLTRITHGETFDAFPVFSNDGKHLLFSSNRNNGGTRDTNLFLVEWKDN